MTNEELVKEIQNGRSDLYQKLWEQTKQFISVRANDYHIILDGKRVDVEDLEQAGYLALVDAAKGFEPGEASFLHYLTFHLKRQFRIAAGLYTERTARDPVFTAESLYSPVGEDEGLVLADIIADSRDDLEETLDRLYAEELSRTLWRMVDDLPDREAVVIRGRYKDDQGLRDLGDNLGISPERVRQIESEGLRRLRCRRKQLEQYIEDVAISSLKRSGLGSFKRTQTSGPEWAVMTIEKATRRPSGGRRRPYMDQDD